MNSSLIKRKFEKSINTYDQNALAQKEIAENLFDLLLELYPNNPSNILEIGCGTGLLTKKISSLFCNSKYYVNDINDKVEPLISKIFLNGNYSFVSGDAQLINFPENIDLIVSSSTMQWFSNLPLFSQKSKASLNNNGYLFLSTFGKENLWEIREITGTGLKYVSKEELREIFSEDFEIIHLSDNKIPIKFNTSVEILTHLRNTGVNAGCSGLFKTKTELTSFCNTYNKMFSDGTHVTLTYNPIYIVLKKK